MVHTTLLGGGFGRKSIADVAVEAVQVSQKMAAPVQLVWTREDDMQHDFYRPASLHRLKGSLDAAGRPAAWWHRMTSTSINAWFEPGGDLGGGEVGGAENLPYAIPNLRFEYADTQEQRAARLVALGRTLDQRLRRRELHRRAGGSRQGGPARVPPLAARRRARRSRWRSTRRRC